MLATAMHVPSITTTSTATASAALESGPISVMALATEANRGTSCADERQRVRWCFTGSVGPHYNRLALVQPV